MVRDGIKREEREEEKDQNMSELILGVTGRLTHRHGTQRKEKE